MLKVFAAVTTGTSLLKHAGDANIIERGLERLAPDDPKQEELRRCPDELVGRIAQFVEEDPEVRSAELNTLVKFAKRFRNFLLRSEELRIKYYVTDTGAGELVGRILTRVDHGGILARVLTTPPPIKVEYEVVRGFGRRFEEGLVGLVETLARDLVEFKKAGYWIYLMATGGYKPETAFASIASMVVGVRAVVYVHESFKDVVWLPRLPIGLSEDLRKVVEGELSVRDFVRRLGYRDLEDAEADGIVVGHSLAPWVKTLVEVVGRA